jgi:hypothetical protein
MSVHDEHATGGRRDPPQHVFDTRLVVDREAGLVLDPADLADDFGALVQQ